jgi:hypothetical protein
VNARGLVTATTTRRVGVIASALLLCVTASAGAQIEDTSSGWQVTLDSCAISAGTAEAGDADRDGVTDDCEWTLAMTFRPLQRYDPRDDIGGEPYYAVRQLEQREYEGDGVAYRILYMPAYYQDLGWEGGECRVFNALDRLRFWRSVRRDWCAGHNGDSEFMVFDVTHDRAARKWQLTRAFLSAHWLGRTDDSRTFDDPQKDLVFPDSLAPHPEVWVAYRKHGSYATRLLCDAGHRGQDTCAGNTRSERLVLEPHRNVGSRRFPAPNRGARTQPPRTCVASEARFARTERHECFWDPADTFDGWQQPAAEFRVTPYERALREFGF